MGGGFMCLCPGGLIWKKNNVRTCVITCLFSIPVQQLIKVWRGFSIVAAAPLR